MNENQINLIDYVISHNRRLVSPVGWGSEEKFNNQIETSGMSPAEKLAQCMDFQAKRIGHDFVFSSIPHIDICKYFGLKTYLDTNKDEHVCPSQINSIRDLKKIKNFKVFDAFMSNPYIQAVKEFRKLSSTPLGIGGFGPVTLASYVLGVKNFLIKCIEDPLLIQEISNYFAEFFIAIASEGEGYGADYLWVGEPIVVMISPEHFTQFSGQYVKKIFDNTSLSGFLHVPGDTNHLINEFVKTGAQCLSIDYYVDLKKIAYTVPPNIVTLGNINSISLLMDNVKTIEEQVIELNEKIINFPNFIVSSGGGILDGTPEKNLRVLFDVTKRFPVYTKEQYNQINNLWRMIAANDWELARNYISENNVSNTLIATCRDEACAYLKFQLENNRIDLKDYNKRTNEINMVQMKRS